MNSHADNQRTEEARCARCEKPLRRRKVSGAHEWPWEHAAPADHIGYPDESRIRAATPTEGGMHE